MYQYSITKYDKAKRDSEGLFWGEPEWTESSDIGRKFNGTELTLEEYLSVEKKYIDAAIELFKSSKLDHLRLT